jgi:hypothetical protein
VFDKLREIRERREQEKQAELERLKSLSEKELLLEILVELKNINARCEDIRRTVILHS